MKISSSHKRLGDETTLLTTYDSIGAYDKVYVSKAFTDTPVPDEILTLDTVVCEGTGFFYDRAPLLQHEVEHCIPDYHLYDEWVAQQLAKGGRPAEYTYYTDYSIGFATRGCFRQCDFCVNKGYTKCEKHSPVAEFLDDSRKKICLLDDNFFACPDWREAISEIKATGKRFQFKQGLDERLLTGEKIDELMSWSYDGDYIFAFDNIDDKDVVEGKLRLIRAKYPNTKKHFKFYVLCGFDRSGKWDESFWIKDIREAFERIRILTQYEAIPYIMRYEKCYFSPYRGVYSCLAGWCNQPSIFKKFTFREYCMCKEMGDQRYSRYKRDFDSYLKDGWRKGSAWRYMESFEEHCPEIARIYYDMAG